VRSESQAFGFHKSPPSIETARKPQNQVSLRQSWPRWLCLSKHRKQTRWFSAYYGFEWLSVHIGSLMELRPERSIQRSVKTMHSLRISHPRKRSGFHCIGLEHCSHCMLWHFVFCSRHFWQGANPMLLQCRMRTQSPPTEAKMRKEYVKCSSTLQRENVSCCCELIWKYLYVSHSYAPVCDGLASTIVQQPCLLCDVVRIRGQVLQTAI
jgi:hypothetical protein